MTIFEAIVKIGQRMLFCVLAIAFFVCSTGLLLGVACLVYSLMHLTHLIVIPFLLATIVFVPMEAALAQYTWCAAKELYKDCFPNSK